jgi:threonine/homoserine/homoserine lactone efflux protein
LEPGHYLSLIAVCLLGAMSPGPSLAVVMGSTLRAGPGAGYACSIAHGAGVALYALLTVAGLAVLVVSFPLLFLVLQLAGAAYLVYLGVKSLRSRGGTIPESVSADSGHSAASSGFLVAFLNPKLAIFMLALFSQFMRPEADWVEKGIMVATVGITDASWYVLVVAMISRKTFLERLRRSSVLIDRIFGMILLLLAISVLVKAVLEY